MFKPVELSAGAKTWEAPTSTLSTFKPVGQRQVLQHGVEPQRLSSSLSLLSEVLEQHHADHPHDRRSSLVASQVLKSHEPVARVLVWSRLTHRSHVLEPAPPTNIPRIPVTAIRTPDNLKSLPRAYAAANRAFGRLQASGLGAAGRRVQRPPLVPV